MNRIPMIKVLLGPDVPFARWRRLCAGCSLGRVVMGAPQADGLSQAEPEVSALPGFDPSRKWRRGRVRLAFPDAGGCRTWMMTDGYTDGTFILDRRAYSKSFMQEAWGYVISHAASGYAICGVKGPLSKAKALVEQIRHLDWNFAEPEALPPETKSAAPPIMKASGGAHVTEFLKADWEPIATRQGDAHD